MNVGPDDLVDPAMRARRRTATTLEGPAWSGLEPLEPVPAEYKYVQESQGPLDPSRKTEITESDPDPYRYG